MKVLRKAVPGGLAFVVLCLVAAGCAGDPDDVAAGVGSDLDEPSEVAEPGSGEVTEPGSGEITEASVSCLSERLFGSTVWLENPVFGEPRLVEETYPDGSVEQLVVVDLVTSTADERSESALTGDVRNASTLDGFGEVVDAAPSEDGADVALVVANSGGFFLASLVDTVDGRVFAWTGCESKWTDYTDLLAEWSESSDAGEILAAMRDVVLTSQSDEAGYESREAEANRLFELATGEGSVSSAWIDRPASERSFVDMDTPDNVRAALVPMLISIDDVQEVGDPDLVLCPVQDTATAGYCFGIDVLANAYEPSVIRIAVLPDEPLRLLLGRESLWDVSDHEVDVATLPAGTEAAALRVEFGTADHSAELEVLGAEMDIRLDPLAAAEIDVSPDVQYLGGTEPYEGA